MLSRVVGVLGVGLEGNLCGAQSAGAWVSTDVYDRDISYAPFDVETEDLDTKVVLSLDRLLSSVELLPFVNVFTTSITSPTEPLALRTSVISTAILTLRMEPSNGRPAASSWGPFGVE